MPRFNGNGLVWSPEEKRVVCKFVDGVFETEDEALIEYLEGRGYEGEEVEVDEDEGLETEYEDFEETVDL